MGANGQSDMVGLIAGSVIRYLKGIVITLTILGLIVLNVATLVNEQVHTVGYQALKSFVGLAIGEAAQSRLFSSSLTTKRNLEITKATQMLQVESHALKRENLKLSKSNQELTTKIAKRTQLVSKLMPSMRARASRVAVRNVNSVVGRGIPYIGIAVTIAVTIGVTAADLHDMCEQDKEISALLASHELTMAQQYTVCGLKVPTKRQVVDRIKSGWQASYVEAVSSVNQSGLYLDSLKPPTVGWGDVKSTICPVLTYKLEICD